MYHESLRNKFFEEQTNYKSILTVETVHERPFYRFKTITKQEELPYAEDHARFKLTS